jgi:hypothetical protein
LAVISFRLTRLGLYPKCDIIEVIRGRGQMGLSEGCEWSIITCTQIGILWRSQETAMPLELNKVRPQVEAMGKALAHEEQRLGLLLQLARRWFSIHAGRCSGLRELAARWHAAIPGDEPLTTPYPLPPHPDRVTIIGADGSQIQPDRHGLALYYLINIGSIVFCHGSGECPRTRSLPKMAFGREELYEEKRLVQGNLLDVRRDIAELSELADLAEAEGRGPLVALVDGTLLLWVLEESPPERRWQKVMEYLGHLERLRRAGAAVGAFISRPRHAEVVALLHLAELEARVGQEGIEQQNVDANPLEGLTDRLLFGFLRPGERSALFVSPSPVNADYHEHQIYFFYVNVGTERSPEIARVETPRWVAAKPELLNLLHAAICEQCHVPIGYPYVLARAHELATIGGREREELEAMVIGTMVRHNLTPAPSEKARLKQLTSGGRRRHRL